MTAGVIFDVDGVLLDSMPVWNQAGELYLQSLGILSEPDLGKIMFSMSMQEGAAYLLQHYPITGLTETEVIDGINKTIQDFYFYKAPLKPGVKQFLSRLYEKGLPMTIATSSDRVIIEAALKRTGIYCCFSRIFTCSETGNGKDHPDIYLEAASWMQTEPKDTWVFEDALHALATAKKAGFRCVGVYDKTSEEAQADVIRLSDIYIKQFTELTLDQI